MAIEKGLLLHWWHYYGKGIYTFEELQKFEEIIDQYGTDKVLEAAVASYVCFDGSPTVILGSIRADAVEDVFNSLPNIDEMSDEDKIMHEAIKNEFVERISATLGSDT